MRQRERERERGGVIIYHKEWLIIVTHPSTFESIPHKIKTISSPQRNRVQIGKGSERDKRDWRDAANIYPHKETPP